MLAVTGAATVGTVVDLVIASLGRLNDTIAAHGRNAALSITAATGYSVLTAKVASFTVLSLDNRVTAAGVPYTIGPAIAVAADIHAVVALLTAIRTVASYTGIAVIDNGIAAIGIEGAGRAAAAALGAGVAITIIALFTGLNEAIATARWEFTTRATGA